MRLTLALVVAAALTVMLATLLFRLRREASARRQLIDILLVETESTARDAFSPAEIEELPGPVRRYLGKVLKEGQPRVRSVELRQRGEFRLGETWREMEAEQFFTTRPPGFVWSAKIRVLPLIVARVVDNYVSGAGSLRVTVLSFVVAEGEAGPELDEGELVRFLGEAVWFPTVLLPGGGVEWESVDDSSARATLRHGETEASLLFHFGEDGLVERVTGMRPRRAEDGGFEDTEFMGRWQRYRERSGMLVPMEGEAQWDDEAEPYWQARLTDVSYR